MAIFATVVGFVWFYEGVDHIGATRAGLFINLVPICAVLLAFLILGEPLTLSLAAGAALVLSGVYLTNRVPPVAQARLTKCRHPAIFLEALASSRYAGCVAWSMRLDRDVWPPQEDGYETACVFAEGSGYRRWLGSSRSLGPCTSGHRRICGTSHLRHECPVHCDRGAKGRCPERDASSRCVRHSRTPFQPVLLSGSATRSIAPFHSDGQASGGCHRSGCP